MTKSGLLSCSDTLNDPTCVVYSSLDQQQNHIMLRQFSDARPGALRHDKAALPRVQGKLLPGYLDLHGFDSHLYPSSLIG